MPPPGPLPMLPRHCVARLIGTRNSGQLAPLKASERRPSHLHQQNQQRMALKVPTDKLDEELDSLFQATAPPKPRVNTESKQIQTTEQDAQWEWQHVWKGAFKRLKLEMQDKNSQLQSMTTELKELQALVAAQKHAIELQGRVRDDAIAKHRAEVDNLRAVHALEIEDLKSKQKKQLQDVALQNEQILRQRRRDKEMDGPFNMQSERYGDFLAYIDDFYSDTLRLTNNTHSA